MKIRHVGPQKSIRILAVGILICWAVAGKASEQWDARASARVNLRTNPSLNGVILSIVPKGHKVRIMEKQGLWCKVNLEGEIHGKGWVHSEYLEEILPKAPATGSAAKTVRVEIPSGEQKQGLHPGEPPPKTRTDGEAVKPLRAALPANASIVGKNAQSSVRNEQQETKIDTGAQSKAEIHEPGESGHIAAIQALSESQTQIEENKPLITSLSGNLSMAGAQQQDSTRNQLRDTKNELIALSPADRPIAREPAHMPPVQPAVADLKQDVLGISEKSSSGVIEQGNADLHQKGLPGGEKKQDGAVQETPFLVKEKAVTDVRAVAAHIERPDVSRETIELKNGRQSMGPVEITLKLLAIALSCLVILFLYRANKIASNHYDALMQFQHSPEARQ
mgnify:CR=1 FL=1